MQYAPHFRAYQGPIWRAVEAQHISATMGLVDSLAEQEMLEEILEASKPKIPEDCAHLHYLISTPFRYGLYPFNSRFRAKGETPGVFYAAEDPQTAMAETIWQRYAFFAASPQTPMPQEAGVYTVFAAQIATPWGADLLGPPFAQKAAQWHDPNDYTAALKLAQELREEGCEVIRYRSVRHPAGLANLAVLSCRAFARADPIAQQTWHMVLRPDRARLRCEHPQFSAEFTQGEYALQYGPRAGGAG